MNKLALKVGFALLLALLLFPPVRSVAGRDGERTRTRGHHFVLAMPASSLYTDYQVDYPRLAAFGLGILVLTGIGAVAFRKPT